MIGTYDYVIAALSVLLSLGTALVCLRQQLFYRYFLLNLYLIVSTIFTLATQYLIHTAGYTSIEYFYFYYTGDAIGTIVGYLAIASLFDQMLRHSILSRYVRPTLGIFFLLVVVISGVFISRSVDHLYSRFVIEFQQNMYFVGVLLTFLLWLSMSYLGAETRRFALLVSGLGIYFAAHACNYAARFLFPGMADLATRIPPLAYNLMILVWFYTFLRIPEGEPAAVPARRQRWAALHAYVDDRRIE
ncbi:MAG: hypothetical protein HY653_02635 [Acidobacteria bacterium]|nr:hypothetical protein [Acidobacteriota bacterium]